MDKNTVIGFVLIFLVLIGFSYLNQPSKDQIARQKQYSDSIALILAQQAAEEKAISTKLAVASENQPDSLADIRLIENFADFAIAAKGEEQFITVENDLLTLTLSNKGARVVSAQLKNFTDYRDRPLIIFDKGDSEFYTTLVTTNNRIVRTGELFFNIIENSPEKTIFRLKTSQKDAYIDFVYVIHANDYILDFNIEPHNLQSILSTVAGSMDIHWQQKIRQQEKGRSHENSRAQLYFKYLSDDVEYFKESKDDIRNIPDRMKWIGFKDQFFSSVLIAKESFGAGKLESKDLINDTVYLKNYIADTSVEFDAQSSVEMTFFFGPNDYQMLKAYDKTLFAGDKLELERLVPLGWSLFRWVNKYIVIPIFGWLTNSGMALGLAIFLLTLIVKIGLFPLTWKSFMSSAKMRVMKPQISMINEKYPGQDNAMTRQQKTMELYRQVGINPMAGCLPMLLQMPILLALYMFFPSAIELRHQSFLWANDLATYDDLIKFNFTIPFLGSHLSLFCLLMAVTNVFYSKFSMEQTSGGQEQMPGMKLMIYVMPVMMLFVLNSYPSGLNYYYFISSLITILQTLAFRWLIDEKALLAKLEANKKNPPKKKSGFMARLEEAQRKQQALLKEQQKKNARKR
ncbi:MAG: membrane protein insertase YidC [Dysgonamonadaceae bacterium]|jgi:YidC/Oxa1 family membrane protein insertase|nr:membrane protein insertase YidC [Dysgonamonadaceae bacterium]